ncbi:DOPA 4,5-dioxygenase family protein [Pseudomaricurvus alkylphenolicus]|jgi:DOPA 4,5-dioxygenase|uniref:DOPA 4,5-dioxygenase family protein n=1 Tax=Pseudomaricurvus alkylphenolicus TaxID=1306991 RepID=UPI00142377C8|nr:DOPA 4,5-dioxygenase family protein [Pseudomaricurvus alkylphenolicus]NIB44144.1 DOPA 4,5-dioxygenase family protein [Pseudomaricurvus alkylphenolicus]
MPEPKRPVNSHKAYHAHIYFDEASKHVAKNVCNASGDLFGLKVGRFHEKRVGPHPCWSCQITFGEKDFESYILWLDQNRQGLTVFVHALTGDDLKDHTEYAYWLGQPVALNLSFFQQP